LGVFCLNKGMMMEQRNAKIWSVVSIPQQGNIALTLILGLAIDLFVLICCPLTLWFDFFFQKTPAETVESFY
jgi:hypothetical protein